MEVELAAAVPALLATTGCTIRFTACTGTGPTTAGEAAPATAAWLSTSCALSLPVVPRREAAQKKFGASALPADRAEAPARLYRDMAG